MKKKLYKNYSNKIITLPKLIKLLEKKHKKQKKILCH